MHYIYIVYNYTIVCYDVVEYTSTVFRQPLNVRDIVRVRVWREYISIIIISILIIIIIIIIIIISIIIITIIISSIIVIINIISIIIMRINVIISSVHCYYY